MRKRFEDFFRPLFILLSEEELTILKVELEQVLKTNLEIKKYYQYKSLCVPYNIKDQALIAGLKIADEKNLKGIWLDAFYEPRNFHCFPLKSYFISSYLNGCIIESISEKEYLKKLKQEQEKRRGIENYFGDLQNFLNHKLRISYNLEGKIELSIFCNFSEYEELKKQFMEYERIHNQDIFSLNAKEEIMSR